jgi:virulence factor Mce-like protein
VTRPTGRRVDRLSPFQAGAITLAVLMVVIYFGFTKSNPFASPYELKAAFTTANQIKPKSPVRIAGVQVGKVKEVKVLDGNRGAEVTMQIQDKGLPIHTDATAKIRPRIFLEGNYFVDLEPGSPSAPTLDDGSTLSIGQTAAPVGFGRFLETFQNSTREDLRTIFQELGTAFDKGGAQGLNSALRYTEKAFKNSAIVNEATLGVLEHDLSNYIKHAGKFAEALDRDPSALKSLVTNFAETADALADEDQNLQEAIGVLDDTLVQGSKAFTALNSAFPPLRRLVADLRPATRAAPAALDAQLQLVPQLRKLVSRSEMLGLARELRPTVPKLVELNKGGVALQEQGRQLSSCQVNVVLPTQQSTIEDKNIPAKGKVYEEGSRWLTGITGESRSFDANGQWIKTLAQTANYAYALGNGRFSFTTKPLQGANPAKAHEPPMRSDVPCETQEAPDLRSIPGTPPPEIKVSRNGPGYAARLTKARASFRTWITRQLKAEGLAGRLKLSDTPLTKAEIPLLKGAGR